MKKSHIIVITVIGVIMAIMVAISFIGPKEPETPTIADIFYEGALIDAGTFDITVNLSNNENTNSDSNFQNLIIKLNGTTDGVKTLFGVTLNTGANKIVMDDLVFINNENIYINANSLSNIQGKTSVLGNKDALNKWILLNSAEIVETSAYKELKVLISQTLAETINKNEFTINNGVYTINLTNEALSLICNSIADSIETNTEQWTTVFNKVFYNYIDISNEILNNIIIEDIITKNEEIITEENVEENVVESETESTEITTNEETTVESIAFVENETINEESTEGLTSEIVLTEYTEEEINTILSEDTEETNDIEEVSEEIEESSTIAEETITQAENPEENVTENTTQENNNSPEFSFDIFNISNEEKINKIISFLRKIATDLVNESNIYTGLYSASITNDISRIFTQNLSLKCNENTPNEYSITVSTIFTENNGIELTELNEDKIFDKKESDSIFLKFIKYLTTSGEELFIPNYIEAQTTGYAYKNSIGVVWEEITDLYEKRVVFVTSAGVVSNIYYSISTKNELIAECFTDYYFTNNTTNFTKSYIEKNQSKLSQKKLTELDFLYNNYDKNNYFVLIQASDGLINDYSKLAKNEDQLINYLQETFN